METSIYHKNNPFLATIKERYSLTLSESKKNTQHVVLDLSGSGLTYEVGDSIGIYPINNKELVDKTLKAMRADGSEMVHNKHSGQTLSLREFLAGKANLTDLSRKLLSILAEKQPNPEKKEGLLSLLAEDGHEKLKTYLEGHELWDALLDNSEVEFPIQDLCNLLMPLLPRLYSISSSMSVVGEEVHLTVGVLKYSSNGHQRVGVCTHFLCDLMPMHEAVVPVYIQKHHGFTLPPQSEAPIIMIGPGTGVAPFRAFLQERVVHNAQGKNWLFFGECNQATDYYYEQYWKELEKEGKLRLTTAFSRDQEEKIYVQHRMLAQGADFYKWIEQGAYIYVCGDASRMAKDVEATLHEIIRVHGNKDEAEAKALVKKLRTEKRYLRDVY
jgi:sulfite reductase (NADPH) flavoprotein alpha-component